MYCKKCKSALDYLGGGGCGTLSGCPKCGAVYEQLTGGLLPTLGGERIEQVEGVKYDVGIRKVIRLEAPSLSGRIRRDKFPGGCIG